MLVNAIASALLNLVLLAGIPFLIYSIYHKVRNKRSVAEAARRAGLQVGDKRYLLYSALFAVGSLAVLAIWSPPLEPFLSESSPQRPFKGLGFGGTALALALLYGVVQTGFSEEFFFRGLIAGSLSRRLSLTWANLLQAIIFLLPHLLILLAAPDLAGVLLLVFAGALFKGWVRIKSGSMLGPWLIHAALNVATCLSVAIRSAG